MQSPHTLSHQTSEEKDLIDFLEKLWELEHGENIPYRNVPLDAERMDGGAMDDQPTHSVELMNVRHSKPFNTLVGDYIVLQDNYSELLGITSIHLYHIIKHSLWRLLNVVVDIVKQLMTFIYTNNMLIKQTHRLHVYFRFVICEEVSICMECIISLECTKMKKGIH